MNTFLRSIVALSLFLTFSAFDQPVMASDQKAVLVTGASTGPPLTTPTGVPPPLDVTFLLLVDLKY